VPVKKHSVEQIIAKLREIEKLTAQGMSVPMAARKVGVTDQTFYRWRLRYGALKEEEAKRLQLLEQENARLKRIVADQALDISMLKDLQREMVSPARRRAAAEYCDPVRKIRPKRDLRTNLALSSRRSYGTTTRRRSPDLLASTTIAPSGPTARLVGLSMPVTATDERPDWKRRISPRAVSETSSAPSGAAVRPATSLLGTRSVNAPPGSTFAIQRPPRGAT
jgi:transposase-like protein